VSGITTHEKIHLYALADYFQMRVSGNKKNRTLKGSNIHKVKLWDDTEIALCVNIIDSTFTGSTTTVALCNIGNGDLHVLTVISDHSGKALLFIIDGSKLGWTLKKPGTFPKKLNLWDRSLAYNHIKDGVVAVFERPIHGLNSSGEGDWTQVGTGNSMVVEYLTRKNPNESLKETTEKYRTKGPRDIA
jgi:hypothetical protein